MDGSRLLGQAQERVALWLQANPTVELHADPHSTAIRLVNIVLEVLNREHIATFTETGWRLDHDLRCWLGLGKGCLVEGPRRSWIKQLDGAPAPPGRYRVGLQMGSPTPVILEALEPEGPRGPRLI
jgi:hypothetical protein